MRLDRRAFLNACTSAGIASPLLPGILFTLAAQAQESAGANEAKLPRITPEMIDQAAMLAGVGPFTPEQKKMMLDGLNDQRDAYAKIRALKLANSVPPAFVFHPQAAPEATEQTQDRSTAEPLGFFAGSASALTVPTDVANMEDLAFATVTQLGILLRLRKITSLALTQMYIARLKRYDPKLHFVITLTEERAPCAGEEGRRRDRR